MLPRPLVLTTNWLGLEVPIILLGSAILLSNVHNSRKSCTWTLVSTVWSPKKVYLSSPPLRLAVKQQTECVWRYQTLWKLPTTVFKAINVNPELWNTWWQWVVPIRPIASTSCPGCSLRRPTSKVYCIVFSCEVVSTCLSSEYLEKLSNSFTNP